VRHIPKRAVLCMLAFFCVGCGLSERQDELEKKQNELEKKQAELDKLKAEVEDLQKAQEDHPDLEARRKEPYKNLRMLLDGVAAYHQTDHYDTTGMPLPSSFPPSAGPTPAVLCCAAEADGQCSGGDPGWQAPGWKASKFGLTKPHYFTYELRNEGDKVSVVARGHLDCKKPKVTFSAEVTVDARGEIRVSKIRGPKAP
jgi:hypothetical protein